MAEGRTNQGRLTFGEAAVLFAHYARGGGELTSARAVELVSMGSNRLRRDKKTIAPLNNLAREICRLYPNLISDPIPEKDLANLISVAAYDVSDGWAAEKVRWYSEWLRLSKSARDTNIGRVGGLVARMWIPTASAVPPDFYPPEDGPTSRDIGDRELVWMVGTAPHRYKEIVAPDQYEDKERPRRRVIRCWFDDVENAEIEAALGEIANTQLLNEYCALQEDSADYLTRAARWAGHEALDLRHEISLKQAERMRRTSTMKTTISGDAGEALYLLEQPRLLQARIRNFRRAMDRALGDL